jgi:hypothetical protein
MSRRKDREKGSPQLQVNNEDPLSLLDTVILMMVRFDHMMCSGFIVP